MADCVFDKIVSGQIPADIVFQDDKVMAFRDINPKAPVHILIIPKKHVVSVNDLTEEDLPLMGRMMAAAQKVASLQGLKAYKLVINTGAEAGQVVMHLHMHLLGGKRLEIPV
ncbi:MAG TPA: histidine triad nucleotide-binding protein [Dehalococcoidales bacterium]|nr:histidine triad nucleotide-binding protein [Dehalococcoidales bacterium]